MGYYLMNNDDRKRRLSELVATAVLRFVVEVGGREGERVRCDVNYSLRTIRITGESGESMAWSFAELEAG